MDVNSVTPFVESFNDVMPQLGFESVQMGASREKGSEIVGSGVVVVLGIVGSLRGNVVYLIDIESAKKIASVMMGGMDVDEFDEMAGSALSELTNMLTATAATHFADMGVSIDISTPTMIQGKNISVKMSSQHTSSIELIADGIPVEVNISFEN